MRHKLSSMLTLAALAMIGLAGCENVSQPLGPEPVGPSLSLETPGASTWTVLSDVERPGGVRRLIGPEGGELRLGSQRLIVPAGAVDGITLFTMKKADSQLRVTLSASRASYNDIGAAGFAKPLDLIFSYRNQPNLAEDPATLKIIWIRPDGGIEVQPTTVDADTKTVTGKISHFSDYAMASM